MAISKQTLDLISLALQDRVLTFKEREVIVKTATNEGTPLEEINAVLDNMLTQRMKSYTKEELRSCPGCGHGVPLISDNCPYCGTLLKSSIPPPPPPQTSVPPPYNISKEAAIIRGENIRTAEEQKKSCPKCGAPYPLVSNICAHCGYVLHEQRNSELNITKLISNIKDSISRLQSSPKPTLGDVALYRLPIIFAFLGAVASVFAFSTNSDMLHDIDTYLFGGAIIAMFAIKKEKSPVAQADSEFYDALHSHEMYSRTVNSLYGDDAEARQFLDSYSADINNVKRSRNKNRMILALSVLALSLLGFVVPSQSLPSTIEKYQANRQKHAAAYELSEKTKSLKPYPQSPVKGSYAQYIECDGGGTAVIDISDDITMPDFANIHLLGDKIKFQLRISNIRLVSTGRPLPNADTCRIGLALFDKDLKSVTTNLLILDPADIETNCPDNLPSMMKNGEGSYYASFISSNYSRYIDEAQNVLNKAEYFAITYQNEK
ncbi:MAG: zinc ribbon domain-containing protein [Bacteroidales bacterium]|nr:zinc ribbon domain-containing protein [Bacteroidales bacterium]